MTSHPHHFDSARRATDLLLRVQLASPAQWS